MVLSDGIETSPSAITLYNSNSNVLSCIGVLVIFSLHMGQDGTPCLIHVNKHKWQKMCMHSGLSNVSHTRACRAALTKQGLITCTNRYRIRTSLGRLRYHLSATTLACTWDISFDWPDTILGGLSGRLVK
jgi:hypothetical protein